MHKIKENKKGSALIFALLILSLVVVTSLTIASTTLTQRNSSLSTSQSTTAFQNADRGMEILLQQVYNNLAPLDTLNDLATQLSMSCDDSGTLSDAGESFSIVATPQSGLVIDCDIPLADVWRFKIVGEHKQAARALQITMQDSLKRGLLAYWNFEDNAVTMRSDNVPGSPVANDSSRFNNHILTLCPEDQDSHGFNQFGACPQIEDQNDVDPIPPNATDIQGIYMDHGGDPVNRAGNTVWVDDGVVDENEDQSQFGSDSISFNGTSHYLTMNTEVNSPNRVDNPMLGVDNAISVSLWIKPESIASATGERIILENRDGSTLNYGIYIDDNNRVIFQIGNSASSRVTSSAIVLDQWHHVLATWDRDLRPLRAHLYVDGNHDDITYGGTITRDADELWIGGKYDGSDPDVFTVGDFSKGYRGEMDDIRIYNRGMTNREMELLCRKAKSSEYSLSNCNRF